MTGSYLTIEVEAERRQEVLARSERSLQREVPAEEPTPIHRCIDESAAQPRHFVRDAAGQASQPA